MVRLMVPPTVLPLRRRRVLLRHPVPSDVVVAQVAGCVDSCVPTSSVGRHRADNTSLFGDGAEFVMSFLAFCRVQF